MRLKSFDFLLFAKLPNWHEEWCMLWWLPSSIQFFEGECNAFTFYYVYFDGLRRKKSPLLFAGRIINGDLPALPPLEKYRKKFNAISAHELFDLKVTVEVKWGFLISFKLTLIIWLVKWDFLVIFSPLCTMCEIHQKYWIWIFELWHFPPIFVLLKLTCLVTLFDRKFHFFDFFWHF